MPLIFRARIFTCCLFRREILVLPGPDDCPTDTLLLSYKIYLYHPYQIIFLIIIVADNIVLDTRMGMLSSLMGRLLATTSAVIIVAAAAASAESKCHEGSLSSSSSPSSLPDCGEIIMLEDFAGPIHQWNEMNDPGTYCIHNVHPVLI